jgi:PAS domain S-box-containing protein
MKTELTDREQRIAILAFWRYGLACLSVAAALFVAKLLQIAYGFEPFVLFLCAMMFSAWFGGVKPGLLAVALSLLAFHYYFLIPIYPSGVGKEIPCLIVAALTSTLVVWLTASQRRTMEALQQSELRYRRLLEVMPIAVYVCDKSGVIQNYNNQAVELWGRRPKLGDTSERYCGSLRLYSPDGKLLAHEKSKIEEVLRTGVEARDWEAVVERPDGSRIAVLANISPLRNDEGELIGAVNCVRDITERKRTEDAVRESQQLLRLVLATLPVGVAVIDQVGDIVLVNAASKRIWGETIVSGRERWAQSKGCWHASGKRIVPSDWPSVRALSEGQTSLKELIDIESFDGQQKTIQNSAAPIHNAEGLIVGAMFVNEDVTEQVRAAEALKNSHAQLRALSARLQTVREEEATRIAREIHDDLGQKLTGLKMDLLRAERKIEGLERSQPVNSLLDTIVSATELVDSVTASVQEIAGNLRPGVLDKLGLAAALQYESRRFQERTGVLVEARLPETELNLPNEVSTSLFRIFQECLTNVARHAGATKVEAELKVEPGPVKVEAELAVLSLRDNGKGIKEADMANPQSLGLLGIKERASLLGGEVILQSHPGQGTSVTVRIPMSGAAPAIGKPV